MGTKSVEMTVRLWLSISNLNCDSVDVLMSLSKYFFPYSNFSVKYFGKPMRHLESSGLHGYQP